MANSADQLPVPPALAAYIRRDVLARPVFCVRADEVDQGALAAADPDALGLSPCVVCGDGANAALPNRLPHAVENGRYTDPDQMAVAEGRARDRLADLLAADAIAPPPASLRFTVTIPTYERVAQTVKALEAVCRQNFPADAFEVVIIDNSPDPVPLRRAVDLALGELPHPRCAVRLLHSPVPGLSLGQNLGVSAARGEIICRTDDDCVPRPDWLAALDAAWRSMPKAGVIGGQVQLHLPHPTPPAYDPIWASMWSHRPMEGHELARCHDWRSYPWGGNWSARREVLWQVGGFPVRYGLYGRARPSGSYYGGEEIATAAAIALAGHPVFLCPDAVVEHHPAPERFTMAHVKRTLEASALLEHHLRQDGLIASSTNALGTASQMLRATSTMVAAGVLGRRPLARDRWLRLQALGQKSLIQTGVRRDGGASQTG